MGSCSVSSIQQSPAGSVFRVQGGNHFSTWPPEQTVDLCGDPAASATLWQQTRRGGTIPPLSSRACDGPQRRSCSCCDAVASSTPRRHNTTVVIQSVRWTSAGILQLLRLCGSKHVAAAQYHRCHPERAMDLSGDPAASAPLWQQARRGGTIPPLSSRACDGPQRRSCNFCASVAASTPRRHNTTVVIQSKRWTSTEILQQLRRCGSKQVMAAAGRRPPRYPGYSRFPAAPPRSFVNSGRQSTGCHPERAMDLSGDPAASAPLWQQASHGSNRPQPPTLPGLQSFSSRAAEILREISTSHSG